MHVFYYLQWSKTKNLFSRGGMDIVLKIIKSFCAYPMFDKQYPHLLSQSHVFYINYFMYQSLF